MLQVILVSKTEISKTFLIASQQILNRSMSSGLDAKNINFGSPSSYIAALAEFQFSNSDPLKIQSEAGSFLRHYSLSFLAVIPKSCLFEIATEVDLFITIAEDPPQGFDVLYLTGNLQQWRTTIINGCTSRATYLMRELCTKVLIQFDKLELTKIFDQYTRKLDKDQMILLLENK